MGRGWWVGGWGFWGGGRTYRWSSRRRGMAVMMVAVARYQLIVMVQERACE